MSSRDFSRRSPWSSPWKQSAGAADEELALQWELAAKLPAGGSSHSGDIKPIRNSLEISDSRDIGSIGISLGRSDSGGEERIDFNYGNAKGNEDRRRFMDDSFSKIKNNSSSFLMKFRDRVDKVGIRLPTVEVRFENITVEAKCHVGSRALPTLLNELINAAELVFSLLHIRLSKMTSLYILKDVSGIIRASRMTLLLGPPSSGKTTLLLTLAGKLSPSLQLNGKVKYNGYLLSEFVPEKTAAYISQHDIHAGEMTVKETLDFSVCCQGVGDRYELLSELIRREKAKGIVPDPEVDLFMKAISENGVQNSLQTDYIMKILGLDLCANTFVGDEMRRGISGGEKKRATTGEMIVGPTKTLFMDEISTGLDSSTTHQVVKSLQQIVRLGEATIAMSLLQPAPETFELFDDIILLAEGHIIYQGPRESALAFFNECGFQCPEMKSAADFLQEVTSRKDQEQYWADTSKNYRFVPAVEFSNLFKKFFIGRDLQSKLAIPFDKKKSHGAALVFAKRSVPLKELIKASFTREWLLIERNSIFYVFKLAQIVIVALIYSSVFLRTTLHTKTEADGAMYIGALNYAMLVNLFNGFLEQVVAVMRLPVFFKQRDLLFYPTWVFTVPNCIIRIPISVIESAIWVLLTYYSVGFAPELSRLFKQILIFILIQQMAAGLFRMVAGLCRHVTTSNTFGCLILLFFISFGGFLLPKGLIPKWYQFAHWISPVTYAYNALMINEMFSPRWMNKFAPDGRKLGLAVLKNMDILTDESWFWISAGALLAFAIFFNALFTLCLMYLNPLSNLGHVIPEEPEEEANDQTCRTWNSEIKSDMETQSLSTHDSNSSPCWRSFETYQKESSKGSDGRMALPFIPLVMSFKDINYYVSVPKEAKNQGVTEDRLQLLRGISGVFRPGFLTALMGESGAGKTTLMDVLAGRKTGGHIEGDIWISGYPKKQSTFARISGYCEQFDVHSPQLTVKESLIISAFLRLPNEVSKDEKLKYVSSIMELVELNILKDALVGIPAVSGLSTEQRKRLTIAVELVANPSIVFMDEPTSGLDARAAAVVMRTVKNTVKTGRTVVCTIHQPNIDIFESFDELILLKKGGQLIYSGPLGEKSQKLVTYFESIPGVHKLEDKRNPAAWMLEESSITSKAMLKIDFAEFYKSSALHKLNDELVKQLSKQFPGTSDLHFETQYPQSSLEQFTLCLIKYWLIYWRNPEYNLSRLCYSFISAVFIGSVYWKIGLRRNSSEELYSVFGAMYMLVLFIGYGNCSTVQTLIASERPVYYREKAAGMYSSLPYAFSLVVIEVPYVLFQTLFCTLITYWMMGFQWTAVKFLWFFIVYFMNFIYFTYYGMLTVAMSPNLQLAAMISTCFLYLFHLFSGIYIPRPDLPVWWAWFYWLCPVSWTLYGLIVAQYGDVHDLIKVPGQADQRINEYILQHFGFRNDFQIIVLMGLMGYAIFFAVMFIHCTRSLNFLRR